MADDQRGGKLSSQIRPAFVSPPTLSRSQRRIDVKRYNTQLAQQREIQKQQAEIIEKQAQAEKNEKARVDEIARLEREQEEWRIADQWVRDDKPYPDTVWRGSGVYSKIQEIRKGESAERQQQMNKLAELRSQGQVPAEAVIKVGDAGEVGVQVEGTFTPYSTYEKALRIKDLEKEGHGIFSFDKKGNLTTYKVDEESRQQALKDFEAQKKQRTTFYLDFDESKFIPPSQTRGTVSTIPQTTLLPKTLPEERDISVIATTFPIVKKLPSFPWYFDVNALNKGIIGLNLPTGIITPLPTGKKTSLGDTGTNLIIDEKTGQLQPQWLVSLKEKIPYEEVKDFSKEDTVGRYDISTDKILIKEGQREQEKYRDTLLHEAFHKTGNRFLQLLGINIRNIAEKTIDEDIKTLSKGDEFYDLRLSEVTSGFYEPSESKEEKLARFTELFPQEIISPTTKTGEYISKKFIKEYGIITTNAIPVADIKAGLLESIGRAEQSAYKSEIERFGVEEKVKPQFEPRYQQVFEDLYGEKVIKGELTLEEASKQFGESREGRIIQQDYAMAVNEARPKKFTVEGAEIVGLGIARTGVSLIPTTVEGAVATGLLFYGGYKLLSSIPKPIIYGYWGYEGVKGVADVISPLSTSEKKFGGLLSATVSASFLAYAGVRYLRSPVIETRQIIARGKLSASQQEAIRSPLLEKRVVRDIFGKTTEYRKYLVSQTTEQVFAGRRTIVSTKFRKIFGLDPIYQGIPYADGRIVYQLEGLGYATTFESGGRYADALKKLKSYGFTEAQARATLRYYQPKIILTQTKAESLLITGDLYKTPQIITKGSRIITQPARVIDEKLGIITRSARTKELKFVVRGEEFANIGETVIYKSNVAVFDSLAKLGKQFTQYEQLTAVKSKGMKELLRGRVEDKLLIGRRIKYEAFDETSLIKQTLPSGRVTTTRSSLKALKEVREPLTIFYDREQELGFRVREQIIRKQIPKGKPLEQYTRDDLKRLIKDLRNIYGSEITPRSIKPPASTTTASFSGVESSVALELKTSTLPTSKIATPKIKEIEATLMAGRSAGSSASRITGVSATALASSVSLRSALLPDLKVFLRIDNLLRSRQQLRQRTIPASASRLNLRTELGFGTPQTPTTTFITPTPPRLPPSTLKPALVFGFDENLIEKDIKKLLQRTLEGERTYIPDFTSKALGFEPIEISEKQAQKLLKQTFTGIEVRRPVRIRR